MSTPASAPPADLAAGLVLDRAAQDLLFREARSASAFTGDPVDEDQLRAIYDLTRYGPTSLNLQSLRIVAVRSEGARQRLLVHLDERNRAKAAAAPLVLILAADLNFHEKLPEVFPPAPYLRAALEPRFEERVSQARFNATLQIGYLIVAIRAAGLAAGPMIGFDAAGVDRDFFPDGGCQALLLMNVGRGMPKRYPRLPRLAYHDVVSEV
jgi:3-hydroxypropanoate dehydrogenase